MCLKNNVLSKIEEKQLIIPKRKMFKFFLKGPCFDTVKTHSFLVFWFPNTAVDLSEKNSHSTEFFSIFCATALLRLVFAILG